MKADSKINVNLLRTIDAATIKTDERWINEWLRQFVHFLQDQFINRKWLYNVTIAFLSAFKVGQFIIALINHLLEENAKKNV